MATEVAAEKGLSEEEREKYGAIRHANQQEGTAAFLAVRRGESTDVAMVGLAILAGVTVSYFAVKALPNVRIKMFPVVPSLVGLGLIAGGLWWKGAACHRSTLVGTGAAMAGSGVFFAWGAEA